MAYPSILSQGGCGPQEIVETESQIIISAHNVQIYLFIGTW